MNTRAAEAMDSKDARSSESKVIGALGWSFLMSDTAASPLLGVRAARYMWDGEWATICLTASNPSPVFPALNVQSVESRSKGG